MGVLRGTSPTRPGSSPYGGSPTVFKPTTLGSGQDTFGSKVSSRKTTAVERFNVGQTLDSWTQSGAGAVGWAVQMPAKIIETPVALAGQVASGIVGAAGGDLGKFGDQIFGTPGNQTALGGFLGGLGSAVETISNAPAALLNKNDMEIMKKYGNMPDHFVIPGDFFGPGFGEVVDDPDDWAPGFLGMIGIGRQKTMGELRQELQSRGFTQEDFEKVRNGGSTLEYGDRMVNDSLAVSLGFSFVADPFNLAFFGAGAGLNLLRKGAKAATVGKALGRARGAFVAGQRTAEAAETGVDIVKIVEQQTNIAHQVASRLMANHVNLGSAKGLATAAKGTAKFFADPRGYASRGGYLKRAAAMYGLTTAGSIVPFEDPIGNAVKEFSQSVVNNQPMSTNQAFLLASVAFSPVVRSLKEVVSDTRQVGRASGFQATLTSELEREFRLPMAEIISKHFDGEDNFNRAILGHAGSIELARMIDTNPSLAPMYSQFHATGNRLYSVLDPMIRDLAEVGMNSGRITGPMLMKEIREAVTRPEVPGWKDSPVEFDWSPELYSDSLRAWRKHLDDMGTQLKDNSDFALGLRQIFSKEDVGTMVYHLENIGETMTSAEVQKFLWADKRGLFNMERNELTRLLIKARNEGSIKTSELRDVLATVRDNPLTPLAEDLYHVDRVASINRIMDTPVQPTSALTDIRTKLSALKGADGKVIPGYEPLYQVWSKRFDYAMSQRLASVARKSHASREVVQKTMFTEAEHLRSLGFDDLADKTVAAMNRLEANVKPLSNKVTPVAPKKVAEIIGKTRAEGGATYNPVTHRYAKKGYSVGVHQGDFVRVAIDDDFAISEAISRITQEYPGHEIGTWVDGGELVIDPVRVLENEGQARLYADRYGQDAYFDFEKGTEVRMDSLGPDDVPTVSNPAREFLDFVDRHDRMLEGTDVPAPVMDERLGTVPDFLRKKLEAYELHLREIGSPYTPVRVPAVHFNPRSGTALPDILIRQRNVLARAVYSENWFGSSATSKVARVAAKVVTAPPRILGALFRKVDDTELSRDTHNAFTRDVLTHGGSIEDARAMLDAYRQVADSSPIFGNPRRGWRLNTSISSISKANIQQVFERIFPDASHPLRVSYKNNAAGAIDRAASRTLRRLERRRIEWRATGRGGGDGMLRKLVDDPYNALYKAKEFERSGFQTAPGLIRDVSGFSRLVSGTMYHLFRFMLDVRWYAMNRYEHNIKATLEEGYRAGVGGGEGLSNAARRQGQLSRGRLHTDARGRQVTPIEDSVVSQASVSNNGAMISRVAHTFDVNRPRTIEKVLNEHWDSDPSVVSLRQRFPDDSAATLAERLDKDWFNFDNQGVDLTVKQEWQRLFESGKVDPADALIAQPIIQRISDLNKSTYRGLVELMTGNGSRTNVERTMNSYWLYWPLSYQLQAARWLVRTMTSKSFGVDTNLYGAYKYADLKQRFMELEQTNPEITDEFKDQAIWEVASMMFPITPEDMGVSLNRLWRTLGGATGVFDPMADSKDPISMIGYMAEIGPLYTLKILDRVSKQFFPEETRDENFKPPFADQQTGESLVGGIERSFGETIGIGEPSKPTSLIPINLTKPTFSQTENPYNTQTFDEGGEFLDEDQYQALISARQAYDRGRAGG